MPRMRIFTPAEQTAFDTPPIFTPGDRQQFFAIPESLAPLLDSLRTHINKVGFLVSLGYLRAAKRFFARQFHSADVAYATKVLGMASESINLELYDRSVQSRHRQLILEYLGFRAFDDQARQDMAHDIHVMVRSQMRPKQMLMWVVELLEQRKIEIPSAYVLTELVKTESARHKRVLIEFLDSNLTEAERALLDALLEKSDSGNEDQDQLLRRYRLTLLKKISQSTRPAKIRASVDDLRTLDQLYQQLEPTITKLDLSPESIRYHAHAVLKSDAFHFARRHEEDRQLHLLCFTADQFFRLHDALIDVLLSSVQTTLNICEREHKEHYYNERKTHRRTLKTFVRGATEGAVQPLVAIETISFCHELSDNEKVHHIQEILTRVTLQRTLVQEQLAHFTEQSDTSEDAFYYDILEGKSIRLQNRASELVKQIDLEGDDEALLTAVQHYKAKEGAITHTAPMAFLNSDEQQVVVEGKSRVSLYKALLFIKIAEAIKAGGLNVKHSYRHRSLEITWSPGPNGKRTVTTILYGQVLPRQRIGTPPYKLGPRGSINSITKPTSGLLRIKTRIPGSTRTASGT